MVALLVIINQVIIAFLNADLHALVDREMLLYAAPIAGCYLVSSLLTWRWSNHHWAVMAFLEIMFANGLNLLYITFIAILDNVDLLWGFVLPHCRHGFTRYLHHPYMLLLHAPILQRAGIVTDKDAEQEWQRL